MSVGQPVPPAGPDLPEDGPGAADELQPPLPPLPDALLGPLLDSAGEALRRLQPVDLPPTARKLRAFDRRGLATPAARLQLRRLLEAEEGILAAAAALLLARPEAARLATAWEEAVVAGGDALLQLVSEAAGDDRLPLLASVLTAGLPDGVEFGLGLVVAMDAARGRESEAAAAVRAAGAGQASAEEAGRRAEAARSTAEADVARLESALKEERRARRERDQQTDEASAGTKAHQAELEQAVAEAQGKVAAAEKRMAAAESRAADAEQRATAAEQRVAGVEHRLADAEHRLADAEQRRAEAEHRAADAEGRAADAAHQAADAERRPVSAEHGAPSGSAALSRSGEDGAALDQIARAAEDLAAGLRRLADGPPPRPAPPAPEPLRRPPPPPPHPPAPSPAAAPAAPGPAGRTGPPGGRDPVPPVGFRSEAGRRRAPVRLPPGMLADDPAAVAAMVRTPGVAVIVDGYNVSMLAWPDATAAEQRERLCDALAEFQLRMRCEVTVVFDGAEVPGVRPLRRRGLRVVFSAAGQEADDVVVGEVMFRPAEVPVIVVSSDREVRASAEAEGATVLTADVFLALMRR